MSETRRVGAGNGGPSCSRVNQGHDERPSFVEELRQAGRAMENLASAKSELALVSLKDTGIRLGVAIGVLVAASGLVIVAGATFVVALARLFPSPLGLMLVAAGVLVIAGLLCSGAVYIIRRDKKPREAYQNDAEAAAATEEIKVHLENLSEKTRDAFSIRKWMRGWVSGMGNGAALGIIGVGAIIGAFLGRKKKGDAGVSVARTGKRLNGRLMREIENQFVKSLGALSWQVILPSLLAGFFGSRERRGQQQNA